MVRCFPDAASCFNTTQASALSVKCRGISVLLGRPVNLLMHLLMPGRRSRQATQDQLSFPSSCPHSMTVSFFIFIFAFLGGMQNPSSLTRDWTYASASWSLNCWTAREVPLHLFLLYNYSIQLLLLTETREAVVISAPRTPSSHTACVP